jgi:benzylsuccinate CoA-transferase BbsF subunit
MRPLAGIRIIDLTVAIAGPVATSLLAGLGAEVIRVEPPFTRPLHVDIGPAVPGAPDRPYNRIVSYNDLHHGKRAITLDLSKDAGREALLRLVAISDAVVENMAPRVLPGLGLPFAELRTARDDIVLVSMPAFGATGPLRDRVSYGPGIDAMSGLAHLTGYADRGPMQPANYYCDYNAGALAALATLAALQHRTRTGGGQHVELAMLEGELQVVGEALLDYAMNGRVQRRTGNEHPSMSPHGVYPCAGDDRWIAIACEDDAQWQSLCGTIGRPELARDARFADVVSRVHNRTSADETVAAWTHLRSPFDAERALQAVGIPAGAVRLISELLTGEQFASRNFVQRVPHPEAAANAFLRPAFTLSRMQERGDRPAPLYGQDIDYVLQDLLTMSARDVQSLLDAGIIAREPPLSR